MGGMQIQQSLRLLAKDDGAGSRQPRAFRAGRKLVKAVLSQKPAKIERGKGSRAARRRGVLSWHERDTGTVESSEHGAHGSIRAGLRHARAS